MSTSKLPAGFTRLDSGSIRWRYQHAGRRYTGTAATLSEAKRDRARAIVEAGQTPAKKDAPTVGEAVAVYLDLADVAPVTEERNRQVVRLLPDEFTTRPIGDVTAVHLTSLWTTLAAAGVSMGAVHRIGGVLSKTWQWASTQGWVTSNPARLSPAPTPPTPDEVDPPSIEEVRALIGHFEGHPLALAVRLASVTGARRGEIVALQWDDVRLDPGELVVRRSLSQTNNGRDIHVGETKTGRRGHRTIPLDPSTVSALQRHADQYRIVGCPWVFSHDGRTPWAPTYITRAVGRATNALDADFSFHGLRHFAATQWLSAGVPPSTVAGLLGHTSTNTLLRVYAHWIPAQGRDVITTHAAALDG